MAAQRARFNQVQLTAYFDHVSLPVSSRIFDVSALPDDEKLQYLSLLMKHELVKVPWENIELHYSWHHVVHTDPEHVFDKIVSAKNGRGGYCMEHNSFFSTVLLSLGYSVYMGGSRICLDEKETYGGW
jgi:arylamine N-acetyltransferase